MHIQYQCPVDFPYGWERTPGGVSEYSHQFAKNMDIEDALRYLKDELTALKVERVIISSNYEFLDRPGKQGKRGQSEGVALHMQKGDISSHIACDKWQSVIQNVYALHLGVRHMHMFEEWGIASADYMLQMFNRAETYVHKASAKVTTASGQELPEWMNYLGLGETATVQDANAIYRHRAKLVAHDEDKLLQLNQAIEHARKALS